MVGLRQTEWLLEVTVGPRVMAIRARSKAIAVQFVKFAGARATEVAVLHSFALGKELMPPKFGY